MNNSNYLPQDLLSMILNMRGAEMKKEKEIKDNKNKYNQVVSIFKERIYLLKDDILRDRMGSNKLYHEVMIDGKCKWSDCKKILDTWELWEIDLKILSPVEDEEPDNNLNYF